MILYSCYKNNIRKMDSLSSLNAIIQKRKNLITSNSRQAVCMKKIKIDSENSKNAKYGCYLCRHFSFRPINCRNCNFVACLDCFEEYKK